MRYLIIVKATQESEAGVRPGEARFEEMVSYHEELQRAGVLLDASALQPSSRGWRVRYDGRKVTVLDGPFAETKELVAGYTLIEARSREEAREWTRRFPNPAVDGGEYEVEVRPLYGQDDLPRSASLERFREMDLPAQR